MNMLYTKQHPDCKKCQYIHIPYPNCIQSYGGRSEYPCPPMKDPMIMHYGPMILNLPEAVLQELKLRTAMVSTIPPIAIQLDEDVPKGEIHMKDVISGKIKGKIVSIGNDS